MDIDAFILVGGRSSRFGGNKAEAILNGRSVVGRTADVIRKALDPREVSLVAATPDQVIDHSGSEKIIFDIEKGRGPIGAVHAALSHARTEWAFVVACDFPFVSIEMIVSLFETITDDLDAVAPIQADGRIQPLIAFYRASTVLAAISELMADGHSSPPIRAVFDSIRVKFLPFSELKELPNSDLFFHNVNTQADLERAAKMLVERAAI